MIKPRSLSKYLTFSLVLFSLIYSLSIGFSAPTYAIGFSEGDTKQYNVILNDNNDVGGSAGETTTITIEKIEQHSTAWGGWTVTIDPGNDDPGTFLISADPSIYPTFPSFICALDVEAYLAAWKIGWETIPKVEVSASGNSIKLDVSSNLSGYDFMSTNIWEITYDTTTGWATSFKAYKRVPGDENDEPVLVTHITEVPSIPGYELPIFLAISAIFVLGLVWTKKKQI